MRVRLLGLLSVFALVAGACGSSASETTSTVTATSVPGTTTTTEAKQAKPQPAETTTTAPRESTETSRESPLPVGEVAYVGGWAIRVVSINPDATDEITEASEFNEPIEDGETFFMVALEATYVGDESGTFWLDNSLKVVGDSNVAYDSFDAYCGLIPDALSNAGEAFSGGSITGNECWRVAAADAESLVLIAEESFAFDGGRTFLSLDPSATPAAATTRINGAGVDRSQAIPLGQVAQVGDWAVRVTAVNSDAAKVVADETDFNEPPEEGEVFFLIGLEATYTGTESSTFWFDHSFKVVGDSAVAYETFEAYCGLIPEPIDSVGETFPGGTNRANECWRVSVEDADSLVMLLGESFQSDDTRVMFSLDPDQTPIEASTEFDGAGIDTSGAIVMGETHQVGDWDLKVVSVNPDAEEAILTENSFNDPPVDGNVFYLVTLEATYRGDSSSTFWLDFDLKVVGETSVAYEGFNSYCGFIEDGLTDRGETFPGGTITGDECWSVSAEDADSLVLIAEVFFSPDDDRAIFLLEP